MEKKDVIIIGGGPGGLTCAGVLAAGGANVLLLERKKVIGTKVCAGGITWNGLLQKVPEKLIERSFNEQYIYSGLQSFCYRRENPVIATVDRIRFGQWMLEEAREKGADVREGWHVREVEDRILTVTDNQGKTIRLGFDHLVGADGSTSIVRRFLSIPATLTGVGVNYQVQRQYENMEWHLNTRHFGNGYGWVFPHRESVSIGAYAISSTMSPRLLKKRLVRWAHNRGFALEDEQARAELINYDYRGHHFGNTWLVGDAAGLASGLTGEGIHPAIVSGRAVAEKIIDPDYPVDEIIRLTDKKRRHERLAHITGRSSTLCTCILEALIMMMRLNIVDFQKQLSM